MATTSPVAAAPIVGMFQAVNPNKTGDR